MKANDLLLPIYTGRIVRPHEGTIITLMSNMRWCSDGFEIACLNGQRVRIASDREVMSFVATTGGITAEMIKDLMAEAIEYRFGLVDEVPHRIQWLSDNGSCYTAYETLRFAQMMGLEVCTTPYQSPESNGMAESFIKTFKRDYVSLHDLPCDHDNGDSHSGLKTITRITPIKGLR
ncbi:MAG: IS2 transposase TnpB [Syntrophorhabdus sp. PtaU1.Bin050]|nr:MAG: IS2 transposase TnpB [Syntrophorhabdus sp. PtaU1.Bin050]